VLWRADEGRQPWSSRASGLRTLAGAAVVVTTVLAWGPRPAVADPIADAKAQAAQIEAQIEAQGRRVEILSQQFEAAQAQLQQLGAQIDRAQAQIAQTTAQVATARDQLRQEAVQVYMSGTTSTGLDTLLSSPGEQAEVVREYRSVAGAQVSATIDRLRSAQNALALQRDQLQAARTQQQATAAQLESSRRQAEQAQQAEQATLAKVQGQIAQLIAQQQAAQAAAAARAFQARLAAERAAQEAAAQAGHAPVRVDVPVPSGAPGAVRAAESQLGVPYQWGAESPGVAFDCSGLTQWAWAQAGVSIPRTAEAQWEASAHIPLTALAPGDLVFWNDGTSTVQHVAMYVGGGEVIQAPHTGSTVSYAPIWTNGLVGAGRV